MGILADLHKFNMRKEFFSNDNPLTFINLPRFFFSQQNHLPGKKKKKLIMIVLKI
jgi:hypothetical protein